MTDNIDRNKLNEMRKETRILGEYLNAWNAVNSRISQSQSKINYNDYVIGFEENESEYIVTFSKPFKTRVLGGGVGTYRVKKFDFSVDGGLIR